MKQPMKQFLCLLLALCLPLCACAEPMRWLDPLIQYQEQPIKNSQSTFSIQLNSEAWENLFAQFISITEPVTLDGYTDEEAAAYQRQMDASIQSTLQLLKNYIGALAALFKETTFIQKSSNTGIENTIQVSGQPLFILAIDRDAQGNFLLLSDLFPSYALELSLSEEENLAGDSFETDPAQWLEKILAAAPRFADFHILNAMTQANRMELEALLEKGYAQQDGDTIRYTGTDQELEALLPTLSLSYDPLYQEFQEHFPKLLAALMGTEASEEATDEPAHALIYEVTGDTFYERLLSDPYEITSSDSRASIDSSSVLTTHETKTVQDMIEYRYSPTRMEYIMTLAGAEYEKITVDASEEDAILIHVLSHLPQGDIAVSVQWTRQEEGMCITYIQEQADQPSLRVLFSFSNDLLSHISAQMDMKSGEEWLSLLHISSRGQVLEEAPPTLSLSTQKIIEPDPFYGTYEDEGYKAELRKVAVPKLNMWALTKLPKDARPLLTTLLSIIGSLGQ